MTSGFELLPAIDLRDGQVVRLRQGDFARETRYSDDPAAVAVGFAAAGARWLHVVDLDGARSGIPTNVPAISAIIEAVGGTTAVEVAGGMRTAEVAEAALDAGARRVVLGTAAIRDPSLAGALVRSRGAQRISVAIDVRDGRASGNGWDATAATADPFETIARLAAEGVETFEVTAIDRDGLLGGPDLELLAEAVGLARGRIIASGGISSTEDIAAVRGIGCAGAIVGRALYEGRLSVRDALAESDLS